MPVPGGKTVKLRLTPGSVGRKLRAKGRGFTTKSGIGDLLVIPEVHLPQNLSDEAKEAYSDRKSTRLNSSHSVISYAVFCLKKKT